MPDESERLIKLLGPEAKSFFAVFSRFEYALKRLGGDYLKGEEGKQAEPNWDNLASKLGSSFWEEVRESPNAQALLAKPPKKQIVANGNLDWKCIPINNVYSLLHAVRRVRNNLFHGGKYPTGPVEDVLRDRQLLTQARWILERALERFPELSSIFRQFE